MEDAVPVTVYNVVRCPHGRHMLGNIRFAEMPSPNKAVLSPPTCDNRMHAMARGLGTSLSVNILHARCSPNDFMLDFIA